MTLTKISGELAHECCYTTHLFEFDVRKTLPTQFVTGVGLISRDYSSFLIMIFIFFTFSICSEFKHGHDGHLQQFKGWY